jgi:hypothetical protein
MASRVISSLATLAIIAAMAAPALAQSTGTGSAPPKGSGGSTPSATPAPSATQPSTTTPAPGTGSGATGKAKPGAGVGQSGTTAPGTGGSMPSSGTAGTPQSGTSMTGGASSEQVKSVQKALQDKGMDPGPLDGVMGPKTMAALKAFQKDQKLPESGKLDDQTREKLGVSR